MNHSPFAKRIGQKPEANLLTKAKLELQAQNIPLLDLTVSNPTLCGFKNYSEDLLKSLIKKENLIYEPDPHGLQSARQAVVHYYAAKGVTLESDQIFLTANTSEAYSFIFRLMFDPKAVLAAPQPSYPLLDHLCQLNDVKLKRYSLNPISWKESFSGFLVVHPNNPTGHYISDPERRKILSSLRPNQCLIADEVFLDYPIEEKVFKSFAGTQEVLTFTVSGISKVLGLPQMKLSWIVVNGPENHKQEAIERLELISDTYLSASTPIQNALPDWFQKTQTIQAEIKQRTRNNYQTLQSSGLEVLPIQGGWTAILKLPPSLSDEKWAIRLLQNQNLIVHPGYYYDFSEESCIVISLILPENTFKEGINKIKHEIQCLV